MMRFAPLLILTLSLAAQATEPQPAQTVQAAVLRGEPSHSAASLIELPADSPVTVLQRQGGWYRVSAHSGREGWLPLLSLRFTKQSNAASSNLGQLLGSSAAPAGSVSTGVRGIGEEQLSSVAGSSLPAQVTGLRQYASSPEQARRFAAEGALQARQQPYLE